MGFSYLMDFIYYFDLLNNFEVCDGVLNKDSSEDIMYLLVVYYIRK